MRLEGFEEATEKHKDNISFGINYVDNDVHLIGYLLSFLVSWLS